MSRQDLPQGSYWFFLEYRRRTTLIGEPDRRQEGLGLRIVGHGDASAPPRRPVKAIPSVGATHPARSARRSHTPRILLGLPGRLFRLIHQGPRRPSLSANRPRDPRGTVCCVLLPIHLPGGGDRSPI